MDNVLVTGGSGFVGIQIIFDLLNQGYLVRTTLRSLSKKDLVMKALKDAKVNNIENLSFYQADLTSDDGWKEAISGCDYVLSVASPVFFEIPKDEEKAIKPAVDGILRILKFSSDLKVKRVVMTSNFGAVGFSNKDKSHITNEQDWTNVNEKGLSIYEKSKLLAEKAAWDYIDNNKTNLEFCVINPVAIFGPSLSKHISGSFELLESLLKGAPLPNISLNIVDVRDVATLHVNAMTCDKANHQRFIASCDGEISLSQIASIIRKHRGEYASSLRKSFLPNWAVFFASNFSRYASEGALMLKLNRHIDNSKAKLLLDWKPQFNNEDVVLASIDSMAKFGLLKEK